MIDRIIGKKCTGCTACTNICPKAAIQMNADREGFFYPYVDTKNCVSCGLCTKICPVLEKSSGDEYQEPEVYAGWNRNEEIRIHSTSGGIFSALAKAIIKQGGYVAGAVYNDDFSIYHIVTNHPNDIDRLRQSKYAQSNLDSVFQQIYRLLEQGELVLFCGTPCQSAGLQRFLKKKYEKLYLCDFICRGVISQKVYQKFLRDMSLSHTGTLKQVHFKNKDLGWNRFCTKLTFEDHTYYRRDRYEDYYMRGYLKHNLYLRPSCYDCQFKSIPRGSDLSLGDFWGIGKYDPDLDSDRGTSAILVNSKKGRQLLGWAQDDLILCARKLDEVVSGNNCLLHSAEQGEFRTYFFDHMDRVPFDKLIERIDNKSLHLSLKDRLLRWLHVMKVKLVNSRNG